MPTLTIPVRYRESVAKIGTLDEDAFLALLAALKTSAEATSAKALASRIRVSAKRVRLPNLETMVSALATMQGVRNRAHVSAEDFASDVWNALVEDSPNLIENVEEKRLRSRVASLIGETSIHLTSNKIRELKSEVEREFCGARILTDVRSDFPEDPNAASLAATVLHTLEIRYHDDLGRHREFYVVLDDNDLITLQDAVERAVRKKNVLTGLLKKSKIRLVE